MTKPVKPQDTQDYFNQPWGESVSYNTKDFEKMNEQNDRRELPDAIALVKDGFGPKYYYYPVLCETENQGELIPGRLSSKTN